MNHIEPLTEPASDGTLRKALSVARVARFTRGLLSTGLIEDIHDSAVTLLAPSDDAFQTMPWRFEELLFDEQLLEARFDLFEYLVVRGRVGVEGVRASYRTFNREHVRLGNRLVYGRFGAARVLRTVERGSLVIHVLEQCVYPWDPKLFRVKRPR